MYHKSVCVVLWCVDAKSGFIAESIALNLNLHIDFVEYIIVKNIQLTCTNHS